MIEPGAILNTQIMIVHGTNSEAAVGRENTTISTDNPSDKRRMSFLCFMCFFSFLILNFAKAESFCSFILSCAPTACQEVVGKIYT